MEVEEESCLQTNQSSYHNGEYEQGPGRERAKGRGVNHVLQTEGPDVEAIPASLRENHQTVLVTMYQFLDFHGIRMCQSLLV